VTTSAIAAFALRLSNYHNFRIIFPRTVVSRPHNTPARDIPHYTAPGLTSPRHSECRSSEIGSLFNGVRTVLFLYVSEWLFLNPLFPSVRSAFSKIPDVRTGFVAG